MNNDDALKQNLCLPDRPTLCSSYSSTLLRHSATIFATKLQDMMGFYGLFQVCDLFSFEGGFQTGHADGWRRIPGPSGVLPVILAACSCSGRRSCSEEASGTHVDNSFDLKCAQTPVLQILTLSGIVVHH